ncbi:MAG: hypothetical protein NT069_12855 [Planctomycetota bacterium]|nr:hypothetical protein [Planctomycetota bacterium]
MFIIASVMMKLGRRETTVRQPDKNPNATLVTSGNSINSETAPAPIAPFPPGPAANFDSNKTPHKQAVQSATVPTERSISPHNKTNVSPTETIARTAP